MLESLSYELFKKRAYLKMISKDVFFEKYLERYGSKIYFDTESGYFRFRNNNEFLHRYIYKSFYSDFDENKEIHHIDANHYNNEIWNLIQLTTEQHKKIKHGKIFYGDWISGINELKKIGFLEGDFPSEIIKKLKN
ncbi:HNH endonuclease [Patescibacteria group bacterium]|nr:HNH endonuclease [Patescibacteria group bacterium]